MDSPILYFLGSVFIIILFALAYKFVPKSFSTLNEKEGFSLAGDKIMPEDLKGMYDVVSGPATADLNPRDPYHLLQGVLKNAPVDNEDNNRLNSCACYNIDFANRIQRTGNYTQLTNNYKRANPDSCSAPFHELVNNFYEKQTLNQ